MTGRRDPAQGSLIAPETVARMGAVSRRDMGGQPSLFGADDLALLDQLAAQTSADDREAMSALRTWQ